MKKIVLSLLIGIGVACTPVKRTLSESPETEYDSGSKYKITSFCPIEGDCEVSRVENVSLVVKEVQEGNRGEMSYELIPSETTDVVIYTYKRASENVLVEGFYREEVLFEIPKENQRLILENRNIQDIKMIFGRFCYCQGETGYYKVRRGKINVKYSPKRIRAYMDIEVLDVPQLISNISFWVE